MSRESKKSHLKQIRNDDLITSGLLLWLINEACDVFSGDEISLT